MEEKKDPVLKRIEEINIAISKLTKEQYKALQSNPEYKKLIKELRELLQKWESK